MALSIVMLVTFYRLAIVKQALTMRHLVCAQAMVRGGQGLAFQEYHDDYPHHPLTLGYAGRPGGPAFYINLIDNRQNHGPASQVTALASTRRV